jgi:polyribonucleotide nucleotidyltransferase
LNGAAPLTLETGKVARQADGAVIATYGETTVLATVVSAKAQARPGFLPADRQLPGKDLRRRQDPRRLFQARRPSERERDADLAPDRPSDPPAVPDGYKNDTQVIITVLQHDLENDPDILAMVAASAALTLSGVPFMGPIGGARVGYINGEYVLNPHVDEMPESDARSGRRRHLRRRADGRIRSQGTLRGCHARRRHVRPQGFQPVIDAIIKLAEAAAKEPRDFPMPEDLPRSKPKWHGAKPIC